MKLAFVPVPAYGSFENIQSSDFIEGVHSSYLDLLHWGRYRGAELPHEAEYCARLSSYFGHVRNGTHGKYLSAIFQCEDPASEADKLIAAAQSLGTSELIDICCQFRDFLDDRGSVGRLRTLWGFGEGDPRLEELDSALFSLSAQSLNDHIHASLLRSGSFCHVPSESYPEAIAELSLANEHANERSIGWSPYAPHQIVELKRYEKLLEKMDELSIDVKRLLMDRDFTVTPDVVTPYGPRRLQGYHVDTTWGWLLVSPVGRGEILGDLVVKRMPSEIAISFS